MLHTSVATKRRNVHLHLLVEANLDVICVKDLLVEFFHEDVYLSLTGAVEGQLHEV